jgi:hypothetical protein
MKYTLTLEGKKEFFPNLNNKVYNILLVDNNEKINFMTEYFKNFNELQNKNLKEKFYLGMDFEYNRVRKTERDIALFQINLERDNSNEGVIFVFYPPELSKKQMNVLIDLITNEHMIKIIHGGESLDIPYLFDQVLKDKKLIYSFCKNLFDTKYLCEYGHIEKNINSKCSIYYLLEEYKIITHQKLIDLESIEEKTGPIYLIHIDIHKIKFDVFRYSLYDVLFLPDLIKNFLKKSEIYTKLIPEISHIVFQYKRNIPSENFSFLDIKEIINKYNIHFIEDLNRKIPLDEIYHYHWLTTLDSTWNNVIKITYFKDFFESLLRYLVYYNISKTQNIYVKTDVLANKIKLINLQSYPYINEMIQRLNKQIIKYT